MFKKLWASCFYSAQVAVRHEAGSVVDRVPLMYQCGGESENVSSSLLDIENVNSRGDKYSGRCRVSFCLFVCYCHLH